MVTAETILRQARELIADPAHWTTNCYARDADDQPAGIGEPRACKFCALGAVGRIKYVMKRASGKGLNVHTPINIAVSAAEHILRGVCRSEYQDEFRDSFVTRVNDKKGHGVVLRMFDLAIAEAAAAAKG